MKTPNDKKRRNSNSGSVGQFQRGREKMIHLSAQIIDHPMFLHAAKVGTAKTYQGPRYAIGAVRTLFVKRNQMKRKRAALMSGISGSVRAYQRDYSRSRALAAAA